MQNTWFDNMLSGKYISDLLCKLIINGNTLKILQVITSLYPGGAEIMLANLCLGLKERGHEVKVISLLPLPEASFVMDRLNEANINAASLNATKLTPWRFMGLAGKVEEFAPDIVHSHLFHANITARINRCGRYGALLNTVHTMEMRPHRQWYYTIDRITAGMCDMQNAVSCAARDFHAMKCGLNPIDIPVVYNGINLPTPLTDEEAVSIRSGWNVDDCDYVIGSVGRFCPEKGFDVLLEALPVLGNMLPPGNKLGLVLLGDGEEHDKLLKLASVSPDNIKVSFPGLVPDAARLSGAFDLFVMPSRFEGFGLVLAEAMSHGTPVLVNDIPPLIELLNLYDSGMAIDFHGDRKIVCREIIKAMEMPRTPPPELPFTTENMIEGYLDLYNKLVMLREK